MRILYLLTVFVFIFLVQQCHTVSQYAFNAQEFQQGPKLLQTSPQPSFYFQQNINNTSTWNLKWTDSGRVMLHNEDSFVLYSTAQNRLSPQPFNVDSSWRTAVVADSISENLYIALPPTSVGNPIICHLTNVYGREGECHTVYNVSTNYVHINGPGLIVFYPNFGSEFVVYHPSMDKSVRVPLPKSVAMEDANFPGIGLPYSGVYYIRANESLMVAYNPVTQKAFFHEEEISFTSFFTIPALNTSGIIHMIQNNTIDYASRCVVWFPNAAIWDRVDNCVNITDYGLLFVDNHYSYAGIHRILVPDLVIMDFASEKINYYPSTPFPLIRNQGMHQALGNWGVATMLVVNRTINYTSVWSFEYHNRNNNSNSQWNNTFAADGIWPWSLDDNLRIFTTNASTSTDVASPFYALHRNGSIAAQSFRYTWNYIAIKNGRIFYDVSNSVHYFHYWDEKNMEFIEYQSNFPHMQVIDQLDVVVNVSSDSINLYTLENQGGIAVFSNRSTPRPSSLSNDNSLVTTYNPLKHLVLYDNNDTSIYVIRIKDAAVMRSPVNWLIFHFEVPEYDGLAFLDQNTSSVLYLLRTSPNNSTVSVETYTTGSAVSATGYVGSGWIFIKTSSSLPNGCNISYFHIPTGKSAVYRSDNDLSCDGYASQVLLDRYIVIRVDTTSIYIDTYSAEQQEQQSTSNITVSYLVDLPGLTLYRMAILPRLIIQYCATDPSVAVLYEFCNSSLDCNDGYPCTLDTCNGTFCQHTAIDNCFPISADACPVNTPYRCPIKNNTCVTTLSECYQGQTNCNWICQDGSCVSGKEKCKEYSPQYGCDATQYLCADGSCATNSSECLCMDGKSVRCYDRTCVSSPSECPTVPYLDPIIPVVVVVEDSGKDTTVTIPAGDQSTVGSVTIPSKTAPKDSAVRVDPVPIEVVRETPLPDKTVIVTPVVDVSLTTPNGTAVKEFDPPVTITMSVREVLIQDLCNPNQIGTTLCLAFINTTTNNWQCVDTELEKVGPSQNGTVLVKGTTPHFTSFAVLFDGNQDVNDDNSDSEVDPCNPQKNVKDKSSSDWKWIVLGCVLGAALIVGIVIAVGAIKFQQRKKARISRMQSPKSSVI